MNDKTKDTQENSTDNQETLETTSESSITTVKDTESIQETNSQETSQETGEKETGEKVEFENKDMQTRFTQRMTEIAEKEKAFEAEKEKLTKAAKAYEFLASDPDIIDLFNKKYKTGEKETEAPENVSFDLKDEDFVAAMANKEGLSKVLESKMSPFLKKIDSLSAELTTLKLENAITEFASEKNDFKELYDRGDITPRLKEIISKYPKADPLKQVAAAYEIAKKSFDEAVKLGEERLTQKQKEEIEKKKKAQGEKGSNDLPLEVKKGKSIEEIGSTLAKEMNL